MSRSEAIKFLILRTIGNFLLLFAIFGVLATFGPALYYEIQYQIIKFRGIEFAVAQLPESSSESFPGRNTTSSRFRFSDVLIGQKQQVLIPRDTDFNILIPKLGANAKVFPNVDSTNDQEFLPILQEGVAHAKGTVFPGMKGTIYLFAHSTDNFWAAGRYNAVFYLLKDLSVGDDIIVFFENIRHNYKVFESKIVDSSDVSALVKSQESGQEELILQTCWPPGTTWRRLLVIAKPK